MIACQIETYLGVALALKNHRTSSIPMVLLVSCGVAWKIRFPEHIRLAFENPKREKLAVVPLIEASLVVCYDALYHLLIESECGCLNKNHDLIERRADYPNCQRFLSGSKMYSNRIVSSMLMTNRDYPMTVVDTTMMMIPMTMSSNKTNLNPQLLVAASMSSPKEYSNMRHHTLKSRRLRSAKQCHVLDQKHLPVLELLLRLLVAEGGF